MHYAGREAQPEVFASIPHAVWWAVVTLTTIGYGDVSPVTGLGRVIAAVMAVLAGGLVAFPTGILGAGFVEEIRERSSRSPSSPGGAADAG